MEERLFIYVVPAREEIRVDVRVLEQYPKFKEHLLESNGWKIHRTLPEQIVFKRTNKKSLADDVWTDRIGRWLWMIGFSWRIESEAHGFFKFGIVSGKVCGYHE